MLRTGATMPIDYVELVKAAEIVAETEELKVNVKYSLAGSAFTACTTMIGGVIAGPIGLGAGGILGGITAMLYTQGKYKPLIAILKEDLTENQKIALADHIAKAVEHFQITDLAKLCILLKSNEALYLEIFRALKDYVESDLHYQLK